MAEKKNFSGNVVSQNVKGKIKRKKVFIFVEGKTIPATQHPTSKNTGQELKKPKKKEIKTHSPLLQTTRPRAP